MPRSSHANRAKYKLHKEERATQKQPFHVNLLKQHPRRRHVGVVDPSICQSPKTSSLATLSCWRCLSRCCLPIAAHTHIYIYMIASSSTEQKHYYAHVLVPPPSLCISRMPLHTSRRCSPVVCRKGARKLLRPPAIIRWPSSPVAIFVSHRPRAPPSIVTRKAFGHFRQLIRKDLRAIDVVSTQVSSYVLLHSMRPCGPKRIELVMFLNSGLYLNLSLQPPSHLKCWASDKDGRCTSSVVFRINSLSQPEIIVNVVRVVSRVLEQLCTVQGSLFGSGTARINEHYTQTARNCATTQT